MDDGLKPIFSCEGGGGKWFKVSFGTRAIRRERILLRAVICTIGERCRILRPLLVHNLPHPRARTCTATSAIVVAELPPAPTGDKQRIFAGQARGLFPGTLMASRHER